MDDDDEDSEDEFDFDNEDEFVDPIIDEGFDSGDDALRFLGAEPDVERYLRQGKNCLGRRIALLLPSSDAALEDCMLMAACKLVKLGASVSVIHDTVSAGRRPDVAKRVPFPRCTAVATNLTNAFDVTRAVAGSSAVIVGAAMQSQRVDALETALRDLAERPAAAEPAPDANGDATRDDASVPATPGELASRSGPRGVVEQLVLLSSVEVYGAAGMDEASTGVLTFHAEDAHPTPSEPSAALLLETEGRLAALCNRTAVLRACTLVGEDETPPLETLLSDALGLQDLLVEYLADYVR